MRQLPAGWRDETRLQLHLDWECLGLRRLDLRRLDLRGNVLSQLRTARRQSLLWWALAVCLLALMGCSGTTRSTSGDGSAAATASTSAQTSRAVRAVADRPIPVLLISIDGFRYDYLDVFEPPNLVALANTGARADRLVPSFPSKTFPNHYTLVTGLVPDHHGIVSNNIVDPKLGRFSLGNRDAVSDGRWWQGEPVWVTAQRQGLPSAALFWPGSEAEIHGMRPNFWLTYDDDLPGADRLDLLTEWLGLPEAERPRFLTLYFSRVDSASHRHGPLSHQAKTAVMEVDALIGDLRQRLQTLKQPVHWVVVSDHGMSETAPDRVVFVDDYLNLNSYDLIDTSPVLAVGPSADQPPTEGWEDRIVASLNAAEHVQAYRRENLPEHLRHGSHPRVAPVLALVDDGWRFAIRGREASRPQTRFAGQHGYDPTVDSMGALFFAAGPRIQPTRFGAVQNVDVYSLLCALLEIEPAANDGSLALLGRAIIDP